MKLNACESEGRMIGSLKWISSFEMRVSCISRTCMAWGFVCALADVCPCGKRNGILTGRMTLFAYPACIHDTIGGSEGDSMKEYGGEVVDHLIGEADACIFLFGSQECNVCHALEHKLDLWLEDHKDVVAWHVCVDAYPEFSAQAGVFSVPSVLVYAEGKRAMGKSGYFSLDMVLEQLERYMALMK